MTISISGMLAGILVVVYAHGAPTPRGFQPGRDDGQGGAPLFAGYGGAPLADALHESADHCAAVDGMPLLLFQRRHIVDRLSLRVAGQGDHQRASALGTDAQRALFAVEDRAALLLVIVGPARRQGPENPVAEADQHDGVVVDLGLLLQGASK